MCLSPKEKLLLSSQRLDSDFVRDINCCPRNGQLENLATEERDRDYDDDDDDEGQEEDDHQQRGNVKVKIE